jgi:hypothetical protein
MGPHRREGAAALSKVYVLTPNGKAQADAADTAPGFRPTSPTGMGWGRLLLFCLLLGLLVELNLRLSDRLIDPFQVGHRRGITLA